MTKQMSNPDPPKTRPKPPPGPPKLGENVIIVLNR